MDEIKFTASIRERVIISDYEVYKNILNSLDEPEDPIWKAAFRTYKNLNAEQQDTIIKVFRLIQVNAVSHIFGILDGSTYLSDDQESLLLKTEESEELLNGNLQDIFLEMEEE